jgi:hypothetical protein
MRRLSDAIAIEHDKLKFLIPEGARVLGLGCGTDTSSPPSGLRSTCVDFQVFQREACGIAGAMCAIVQTVNWGLTILSK